mmetsp:Transcript_15505/g.31812  ORF Transcript_15505/g.31812 Transcript_15505/m.31812 type:complete len:421 (-) Transcript_15505:894-2156(-)|eukprot:CAMPEP_0201119820 /NCGR_PEP_ID=MMETSP0850-20130426/3927_1 /ASSEMBLY_ACC=CAM_ASM_000622 /TAXON_ID=183588 /ORGANISM="Pseudo-nitzschia fraudulenta, Strain WWA7" /LENGTH=420 /DNA_ID=CAMNT_0047385701 /DNA_START=286 /DNA_END=1548 /DNA_ORIENTATION=+
MPSTDTTIANSNPEIANPVEVAHPSGDSSLLSLAYLAQLSSIVYETEKSGSTKDEVSSSLVNTDGAAAIATNASIPSEAIDILADRFILRELEERSSTPASTSTKTLFVAIRGTSNPIQHVMNVMPHAFGLLHEVGKAFSTNDTDASNRSCNSNDDKIGNINNSLFKTRGDAYQAGHEQGWTEPARLIYERIVSLCRSANNNGVASTNENPLRARYDRIILTGHSRGGLLAYYVGLLCAKGNQTTTPYTGILKVVAFGMPYPQSMPSAEDKIAFPPSENVVRVVNMNDPVATKTSVPVVTRSFQNWNPITITVGAPKAPPPPPSPATPVKKRGGFWQVAANAVQTVVKTAGNKVEEITADVIKYHDILGYLRNISEIPKQEVTTGKRASLLPDGIVALPKKKDGEEGELVELALVLPRRN